MTNISPPESKRGLMVDVGLAIYKARTSKGLTQIKLAKKLKTKQSSISHIERGVAFPSFLFLLRVAKALNMNIVAPTFIEKDIIEKDL